ncbi:MAG TPA: CHAD domain-containing protein [Bauldia sp.]|nr:CHAD domain-containing protein [Bauldia sp.]
MAHRIGRREPVGKALWRLLGDDIEKARQALAGNGPREERIHRARQRLKRARSALTVMEPALGAAADEIRKMLSGAGRMLGGARDADVAAATARGLRAGISNGDAGLDRVVAVLESRAEEAHRHDTPIETVVDRLRHAEARLASAVFEIDGEKLFARALLRSYAKGRKAMRQAEETLSTPDLHTWRKDVKDLWHLVRLGRKRVPAKIAKMGKRLERLGDLLGRDHDHAVLAEKLALAPDADHSLMRQLAMIAAERRALEKEAFAIGSRLYRRKPKAFAAKARLR